MLDRIRFVLVATSHPGNIGACARAMKNMGLSDLALVAPASFPHPEADARAAGAEDLLARARVHRTLAAAVADCSLVFATSARRRSLDWPTLAPRELAGRIAALPGAERCAVVFGPERIGLDNDQLALASALVEIPANPEYSSLNLGAAVQVIGYECRLAALAVAGAPTAAGEAREGPAMSHAELESYYARLEPALTRAGFIDPENPRHLMRRIRRLYARAGLDRDELNILQGMLSALAPDAGPTPGPRAPAGAPKRRTPSGAPKRR
jgi:TrmH family RNA methyltransferase